MKSGLNIRNLFLVSMKSLKFGPYFLPLTNEILGMSNHHETILGIDIGGNHVKMGLVDSLGHIHEQQSYPTKDWLATGDFVGKLKDTIAFKLVNHRGVRKIGIGLPGTLDKKRHSALEIPNISSLNGVNFYQELIERFPGFVIKLENDANAAALGELHYTSAQLPDDYLFITLGTGIGSAAVLDRQIFIGGDGNALELGHIVSRNHKRLEENIGKAGIIASAEHKLDLYTGETSIPREKPVSASGMVVAAEAGDAFSREVFFEIGEMLGEGLVALVRIMDIKTILIGGGLSASFDFILPGVNQVLQQYLTPYYLKDLRILKASLGNDAGLLGAASLCRE